MKYDLPQSLRFDIGKTRFVAGGFWHKAVSNLSRERARNTADLKPAHVITRRNAAQFGISRLEDEEKPRFWEFYQSAAAALADADPTDWIAAYRLGPTHTWLVAVREGSIDYDAVFTDADIAKTSFKERLGARTWRKAIAPIDWQIEGTTGTTVDQALMSQTGPLLLPSFLFKERSLKKAFLPMAATVVALVTIGTGLIYLPAFFEEPIQKEGEVAGNTQPPAIIRSALPSVIPLQLATATCVHGIYKLFLAARTLPGWEIGAVVCDGKTVSTNIRATQIASMANLHDFLPGASLDITSRTASVAYTLQNDAPSALTSLLEDPQQLHFVLARLNEAYQVRFLAEKVDPSLPGGSGKPTTVRWSLKTQAPPMFWQEAVAHVPSGELSSIQFDPTTSTWSVGGISHVS